MSAHSVLIWDLPTRAFHWLLVLGVVTSYLTGGEEGWLFVVHTASGYLITVLLLFRVIWGIIGSPRSRFCDFVHGPRTVTGYVGLVTAKLCKMAIWRWRLLSPRLERSNRALNLKIAPRSVATRYKMRVS